MSLSLWIQQDICRKSEILPTPPVFGDPVGRHDTSHQGLWCEKARVP